MYAAPVNPDPSALPAALTGAPLDHVAVAVADLDSAAAAYGLLGLERVGADEEVPTQGVRVRTLAGGAVLLELLAPLPGDGPVARFLQRRGPGLHHVALRVTDLEAELARLAAADVPLLDRQPRPGRAGTQVAFIHPRFAGGVLIELVQQP
jgi:methylmalonyl-CoA/ethylmalonyl-CoA epimerase